MHALRKRKHAGELSELNVFREAGRCAEALLRKATRQTKCPSTAAKTHRYERFNSKPRAERTVRRLRLVRRVSTQNWGARCAPVHPVTESIVDWKSVSIDSPRVLERVLISGGVYKAPSSYPSR